MIAFIKKHALFILFTIAYFLLGFVTYKDFGVTYDERVEYDAGKFLLSYIREPTIYDYVKELVLSRPTNIEDRQLPLYSIYSRVYPALLNLFNPHYYFEWFHLLNIIFGYSIFFFSYLLFYLYFKNGVKAMAAPALLAITPEILGHIPANSKDIPFASLYLLGILAIYYFQSSKANKYVEILLLGIIFGVVQSQRTVGLTLFFTYAVFDFIRLKPRKLSDAVEPIFKYIIVFIVSLFTWILCLPFLGANFYANFKEILVNAAGYQEWDHEIIYFGKYLYKDQRPWHYLYVYMWIKLPLITIFTLAVTPFALLVKKTKVETKSPVILLLFLFAINSLLYLAIHPVIYNAIRHFIYMVVIATLVSAFFLIKMISEIKPKNRLYIYIPLTTYTLFTVFRIFNLHPYEYIYYNELIGGIGGAKDKFDIEYWGAAYKEATEYVLREIDANKLKNIRVYSCDNQFAVVYYSKFRFELVGRSRDADFVICDLHKDKLRPYYDNTHPIIYQIKRENTPIFNIRARKS